jgi:hypothetical protein
MASVNFFACFGAGWVRNWLWLFVVVFDFLSFSPFSFIHICQKILSTFNLLLPSITQAAYLDPHVHR